MKTLNFKLLPKKANDREALTHKFSKISPKLFLSKNFLRLKNIFSKVTLVTLIIFMLMAYYPVWDIPPIRKTTAQATEGQSQQILSENLPEPINLPHPGYLSTRFSTWHPGVDIATGLGMPIHPIISGKVEDVIFDLWGLGHHVIISHQAGYKSVYAHMGRVYVKKGQVITTNNTLGEVGLTGHTSGPHTHLEITKNGQYINPLDILPKVPEFPTPSDFKPVVTTQKQLSGVDLKKALRPDFE